MGWVRGQTGEQKEESKAKTSRGSGLGDLGRAEGLGELHSLGAGRGGTPWATTPPDWEADAGAARPFQRLGGRGGEGASVLHCGLPGRHRRSGAGAGRVGWRRAAGGRAEPPAAGRRVGTHLVRRGC